MDRIPWRRPESKEIRDAPAQWARLAPRFLAFCESYEAFFRRRTRSVAAQAKQYLCGLMQARRRNMERMAEVVPESSEQSLQHFLSYSDWDWRPVTAEVARQADELLGGTADTCLVIDETGIPKKGTKSVGVARQWCGQLGKLDNCQVGVFAGLAQGQRISLIDARLYLPKEWIRSAKRCRRAGIPDADRVAKSKPELALEMVRSVREQGVRFQWVAADSVYGNDPSLLRALDDSGELFVVDVQRAQPVYLEDPQPTVPARAPSRGRPRSRRVAQTKKSKLHEWLQAQPESAWQRVWIRHSTRGKLRVEVLHRRVWLWDGHEEAARCWHAFATREVGRASTLKWALSNAPEQTSSQRLAQMQRQRYWIERAFQDAKCEAGMGEYQARGWKAWHHHMALVMMAMLFVLQQRTEHQATHPLLSAADVKRLLAHFLPRQDTTTEEVIRQMEFRHRQRQASIDSAYRRTHSHSEPASNLTK